MVFVETSLFSKLLSGHLNDEEYRLFQYYWAKPAEQTFLLTIVKLLEELSNG